MTESPRSPTRRDFLRRALGTLVAGPAATKVLIEAPAVAPTPKTASIRWQCTNEMWNFDALALETYTNFQPHLPSDGFINEFLSTMKRYLNHGKSTIPGRDAVLHFAVGGADESQVRLDR